MYSRNCPICNKEIIYSWKKSFKFAKKNNSKCISCSSSIKNQGKKRTEEQKKQMGERVSGTKNPFFGKNHTLEAKGKMGEKFKGKKYKEIYGDREKEIKIKIGIASKGNTWNIGRKISEETKRKISIASSGKNNPMYGKPSPTGSGNGWSGWYKGWYFRSLKELSFMIYYIERFNLEWERGEKYRIKYKDENKERNYFPDFVINKKYLIEIKPINLWNTKYVQLKKEAAKNFCKEKKLKYKLIDPIKTVSKEKLEEILKRGELVFLKRYQIKFENYVS